MSEETYRLTPKGCVAAALLNRTDAPHIDALDASEVILETLYRKAVGNAGKDHIPAIAFFGGKWQFVALDPQEQKQ